MFNNLPKGLLPLTSIFLRDAVEVFQDYKKSALLLCTCFCDWKCCTELGRDKSMCQNSTLKEVAIKKIPFSEIFDMVTRNTVIDAVIFGGLEPFIQINQVIQCIEYLRERGMTKDILIYTGYYIEEIDEAIIERLKESDVILKCGRYIPDRPPKFDDILGVTLASDNQYSIELKSNNYHKGGCNNGS